MDLDAVGRLQRAPDLAVDDELPDLDVSFDLAALADDEERVRVDRALERALDPERALERQLALEFGLHVDQSGQLGFVQFPRSVFHAFAPLILS